MLIKSWSIIETDEASFYQLSGEYLVSGDNECEEAQWPDYVNYGIKHTSESDRNKPFFGDIGHNLELGHDQLN